MELQEGQHAPTNLVAETLAFSGCTVIVAVEAVAIKGIYF